MSGVTLGPEHGALQSTRRILISVASGIVTGFAVLSLARAWPALTEPERVCAVVGSILVVVGIVLSRRKGALWIVLAGLLVTCSAAVLPSSGPPWIPVTVFTSYVVYFTIYLSSRRAGLIAPFVGAAALALVWSQRPANVIPGPLGVLGGWGAVAALLLSGLGAWLAWNRLEVEAREADAQLAELEAQTAASLAVQERARAWRAAATRVHESVLNTIRYVLSAPEPDRRRLAVETQAAVTVDSSVPDGVPTVGSLINEVCATAQVPGLVIDVSTPDVALEPSVWEAVRGAVVELVRNAAQHARADRIAVSTTSQDGGGVTVVVTDDGEGMPATVRPGVGTQQVLDAALTEVGARLRLRPGPSGGTVATITAPGVRPAVDRRSRARAYPPFDKARLLVTAPVAGIVLAGVAYFVLIGREGLRGSVAAAVCGLIGIAIAVTIVLRRQRLTGWLAAALVLLPALVPWAVLTSSPSCREAALLAPVINVSGYCIMILTAWSRWWPGVIGLSIWGAGSIQVLVQLPQTCRESTLLAVGNSLIALPLILAVASAGARAYQRAQDRTQLTRRREIMERSRALAAVDINESLQGAVDEALAILRDISEGGRLDDATRRDLERVDGRIRAGIQVDPQSSGAMAVLAKSTVDEVAGLGITVNVRALASSADQRPLPLRVQHVVYRLLAATGSQPTVQAFTDGEEDHLSLLVGRHALRDAGLRPGDTLEFDDVVVEVDDDATGGDHAPEHAGEFAVLVSRSIQRSIP